MKAATGKLAIEHGLPPGARAACHSDPLTWRKQAQEIKLLTIENLDTDAAVADEAAAQVEHRLASDPEMIP